LISFTAIPGLFNLKNVGSGKFLAIPQALTKPGVGAIQWNCGSNHDEQLWRLKDV
jgi:hypothetical protein